MQFPSAAARYWWAIPFLFGLGFYWRTLGTWFRADDFAWLGLRLMVHRPGDLLTVLFAPMAQGTVRFLSDRAQFLILEGLFGLEALPFRIVAVGAQASACVLLALITWRLTDSRVLGILAAAFWTVSQGLAAAMGWISSSNQVLCALFLLGALWLYLEERWAWCGVVFLLGFGTLETMVVFPALAILVAPERWRRAIPFGFVSAAYLALHLFAIPKPGTDPAYAMHFDPASLAKTLWTYLQWCAPLAIAAGVALLTRRRAAVVGVLAFLVLLAPVLPLRDHTLHYYLALPLTGLAIAAASLCVALPRWAGAVLAITLIAVSWTESRRAFYWQKEKARAVRNLVRGVVEARRLHPDRTILLRGVSNELFWDGMFDDPFRLIGVRDVYLAPGAEAAIDSHPEWGGIAAWQLGTKQVRELIEQEGAVVYEPAGESLRNVTAKYRAAAERLGEEASPQVDLADERFLDQIGGGWYPIENRQRWMGREASVKLNASSAAAGEIVLSGYGPRGLVEQGPVEVSVTVDSHPAGTRSIGAGDAQFELVYRLPDGVRGKKLVTVTISCSRTFTPPDDKRTLSLVFGRAAIR
ncbi:MAG: hypothetical protein SFV18_07460 [Bryobacteraceae bacterium]|nr:hypothetical protein [Bryobacteraceae bacterium]